jgi:hypothetical protein
MGLHIDAKQTNIACSYILRHVITQLFITVPLIPELIIYFSQKHSDHQQVIIHIENNTYWQIQ